ncbi:hypothetical protein [Serinicoccus marinus]|uniref:hypothetical protein n=1 Tax=Serinicoccus marinus TaxID=247333 RepID=UPI00122E5303|nr:hypothetical protein [Serinicoccus marinus]
MRTIRRSALRSIVEASERSGPRSRAGTQDRRSTTAAVSSCTSHTVSGSEMPRVLGTSSGSCSSTTSCRGPCSRITRRASRCAANRRRPLERVRSSAVSPGTVPSSGGCAPCPAQGAAKVTSHPAARRLAIWRCRMRASSG